MTATQKGTIIARCSWNAYTLGLLVFDTSVFDGTDTFAASPFSTGKGFVGPYDEMSGLFRSATVKRGRNDTQTRIMRGTCDATFLDPDARFNTANPSSPLAGLLDDRLHPFYLAEVVSGVEYPIFYGWAKTIPAKPGIRKGSVTLQCVDLFYWLDVTFPTIASTGPTTTGAAIGLILDAAGWIDPALRQLDTGDALLDFSADGTVTATQLIEDLLAAELGTFYHSAIGPAVYKSRISRYARTSVATIADRMSGAEPTVDFDSVVNRAKVTRSQSSYTATKTNDISKNKVGWKDAPEIQTPYLLRDGLADDLASWLVYVGADPKPPMRDLTVDNRELAQFQQLLGRELGDRITVTAVQGNLAGAYIVETVEHQIADGIHSGKFGLSTAPTLNFVQFDVSTFDSADVMPY